MQISLIIRHELHEFSLILHLQKSVKSAGMFSLKIVNQDPLHVGFHKLGNKFEMLGMHLVIILGLFAVKNRVQRHLIGLVHDGPGAAHHFADVKMVETGDGLEEFIRAGDEGIGGFGFRRVGPENDDVREHALFLPEMAKRQVKITFGIS